MLRFAVAVVLVSLVANGADAQRGKEAAPEEEKKPLITPPKLIRFVEADYPEIEVVEETFTGWDPSVGAQQALEILTTQDVDGIWTSGIDYTVVEQFDVAGVDYVPVVGADNNEFVGQLLELNPDGLTGAAVSNPPSIGGVGAAVALDILEGQDMARETYITPVVLSEPAQLEGVYVPGLTAGWSSYMEIEPYVSYTADQVVECVGPGE